MTAAERHSPSAAAVPASLDRVLELPEPAPAQRRQLADFGLATPHSPVLHYLAVTGDGTALGAAELRPTSDADLRLQVRSDARRRGTATALLRGAAEGARERGYSQLFCTATDATPGAAFLDAHGFRTDSAMYRLRLRLPAGRQRTAPPNGYALRQWTGAPPADLVDGLADAKRRSGDLPLGGIPGARSDPAKALGILPNRMRRSGKELHTVAAVDAAGGEVVGYTELAVPDGTTSAEQANTIVLPAFRGHALGHSLKSAMLDRLARLHPELTDVETENATDNAPMLAINAALGFRVVSCTRRRWVYTHSLAP